MAVKNATHCVGDRLVMVVAVDQDREDASDGALPFGARPGAL
jgi:hypothetical protein